MPEVIRIVVSAMLLTGYGLASLAICVYGAHRYWITWLFLRNKDARRSVLATATFAELPPVAIQIPMFNEARVAERVIEAACRLRYPSDRLLIQVLDDSTDRSAELVTRCCRRWSDAGYPVQLLHRTERLGYKAGALAAATELTDAEFLAVFDADFIPPPDFLLRTIHFFTDSRVGMVQTKWAHLNRHESLLTECQALFLDGHFVVEQFARSITGQWFNFNGTAGIWRKRCIADAGGWQHDTLTEDTDVSYRAQLAGWRFVYLPTVQCAAELPSTLSAFLSQQHRWTKGLIQTAIKLLPQILESPAPWTKKLEAWFHLTSPVMYVVMLLISLLALPGTLIATTFAEWHWLASTGGVITLSLGSLSAASFYFVSQPPRRVWRWSTFVKFPALFGLGIGLCAVNSRAVVEALMGHPSPFIRTPKFGGSGSLVVEPPIAASRLHLPPGTVELLISVTLVIALILSVLRPFTLISAPFIFLFATGFAAVGALRIFEYAKGLRTSKRESGRDSGMRNYILTNGR